LISAQIFGSAAGATIFAQYGRDKSRLPSITASTFRYLALTSIPLHFIAAALAAPALLVVYGKQYVGAAMVVTIAPLLCLPKAFIGPIQGLLQSYERQTVIIFAMVLASIVDIGVAWYLITAIGLMWAIAIHLYEVKLPWVFLAKVLFISVAASLTAHYIAILLAPLLGILCGGSAAVAVLFGLLILMRALNPEDQERFNTLTASLPKRVSGPVNKALGLLCRPAFAR
jgi:O-antigen/teichoic acid export membrane protein